MTPEQWQEIRPILESALERDPASRASFLDGACADSFLRREVESLIASHEQAGTGLLNPGSAIGFKPYEETRFRLQAGKRIGVYEILEELAVGGMGAVYRASRADGQYNQQVAVKIVRAELGVELTTIRFKNERQILASLNHPNIARLLDGGTTEEGVAYFVMELIEGERIDKYCDTRKISTTERLALFLQVCSAVQYAHQRLIIHRDIKPGNILVNAEGVPKLLDFGIAKILESSDVSNRPEQTISLLRLLTPEYASPEQVRGEPITTASDVYSLGVVLYELLTGLTPYNVPNPTSHEISRAVCETEPEKPSTAVRRVRSSEDQPELRGRNEAALSRAREGSPEKLSNRLRGDLDNIALMALRKEPERRYASVEQFAQDIRRHLEHLPVTARKDTAAYRTSKFIARHKTGVVMAALVTAALLAALGVTLRQARIAERRFNDVRQLANSLIFDVHDSIKDLPGSTPARKMIVDRALQYLSSLAQESAGDPALQRELATAYERVGLVQGHYLQNNLGDTQGSLVSYRKALQLRQQVVAKSSDWNDRWALAQSHRFVANQQWAIADTRAARENIDRAVAISEALTHTRPNDFQVLYELGFDYEVSGDIGYPRDPDGDAKRADNYRRAVTVDEAVLRIKPDDLHALDGYANDLSDVGSSLESADPMAALSYYQKELEIEQKLHQRSTDIRYARGIARTYGQIANVYDTTGDYRRALVNDSKDLAIYQELLLVDPRNTLLQQGSAIAYANTATQLGKTGDLPLSLTYMNKALEIMRGVVASAPQNEQQRRILAAIVVARASTLMKASKSEASLKAFDEGRAIYLSFYNADPNDSDSLENVAACREKMAEAAARDGNIRLAREYFHQALAIVESLFTTSKPSAQGYYTAADSYAGLGDLELKEARQAATRVASQKENLIQARSWYLKSIDAWRRIEHPKLSSANGFDVGDPANVAKKLQMCDAEISKSR